MKSFDPPFYTDETVRATVVQITPHFALLNVRGWMMPLYKRWMSRNVIIHPSELLSMGDRINVVVHHTDKPSSYYYRQKSYDGKTIHGYWLSRWPLQSDPKTELWQRYDEDSVVEVELVNYICNRSVRIRLPDGLEVDLLRGVILPRQYNVSQRFRAYQPRERFKLVIRNHWVQPYRGKGAEYDLAEVGFVTSRIADEKLKARELARIKPEK